MSGKTIGLSMGFGFVGNFSRMPDDITSATPIASDSDDIAFGVPVVLNSDNTLDAPTSTVLTTSNFGGFALAVVKQNNYYAVGSNDAHPPVYSAGQMVDRLRRGVIVLENTYGTPTAGGQVYIRTVLNSSFPDEVVGSIRASADSTNTIAPSGLLFETGYVDSNNLVEVRLATLTK